MNPKDMAANHKPQNGIINLADFHILKKQYPQAFTLYLSAIKHYPECKSGIKEKFTFVLRELGDKLQAQNKTAELLGLYREACNVFPECETVVSNMGALLFQLGYADEAACYFMRALSINPGLLQAKENLENILGHLVERWHFRMLNDKTRNQAYKEAMKQTLTKRRNQTVLDIGSGTGLLAMFASELGSSKVYGCEMSKAMYEMSTSVIKANNKSTHIQIIPKISTSLVIGQDIPQRVDLVVTETFDAGLFGERIIDTLTHAWSELIEPNGGNQCQVIPEAATVYVCAIESNAIRTQSRLLYDSLPHIDLSRCSIHCSTGMQALGTSSLSGDALSEPYTTERLTCLHGGYRMLTSLVAIEKFSFSSLEAVSKYSSGFKKDLSLSVTAPGRLDALCVWFDLHLNSDLTLTSAPDAASCWEQAIYPVSPFDVCTAASKDFAVKPGYAIKVVCQLEDNALQLHCSGINTSDTQISYSDPFTLTQATNPEEMNIIADKSEIHHENRAEQTRSSPKSELTCKTFHLSGSDITRLNDLDFNWTYCTCLEKMIAGLKREGVNVSVLTLMEGFTLIPLQAMKIGASNVCIHNLNPSDKDLLYHIAEENGIEGDRLMVSSGGVDELGGAYSLLIVDLVEPGGCLRQQIFEDVAMARMTALHSSARVMPMSVHVYGMLIQSDSLCQDSKVTGSDSTLGLRVGEFMNQFQMTNHMGIQLSTLQYTNLAEPFHLLSLDLNEPLDDTDDLHRFLNQEKIVSVQCTETGRAQAVVYWFDMNFDGDVLLKLSTRNPGLHWQQAAMMLPEFSVSPGMEVKLMFKCRSSCLSVDVVDE